MAKVLFTCFHPHSLCDVALLWWSLCGGGERGDENSGGPPGRACSRDKWSVCSPAGLSPDSCGGGGGGSPGNRRGLLRGSRLRGDSQGRHGSGGGFSFGG